MIPSAKAFPCWLPMGFCAALSLIALVAHVVSSDAWVTPFLAFLPMAFFMSGESDRQLQLRISVLEKRLEELEGAKSAAAV